LVKTSPERKKEPSVYEGGESCRGRGTEVIRKSLSMKKPDREGVKNQWGGSIYERDKTRENDSPRMSVGKGT